MQFKENTIYNTEPQTYKIRFTSALLPDFFALYDETGCLYFFRYLDGKTKGITINLPRPGIYHSTEPFIVAKQSPIVITGWKIKLPAGQRSYGFNLNHMQLIQTRPGELDGTPARIYYETGDICIEPYFWNYPEPIREFIIYHEMGHFFYKDEDLADLFALKHYLLNGNNCSMAFYSLSHILHIGKGNIKRLDKLFSTVIAQNYFAGAAA